MNKEFKKHYNRVMDEIEEQKRLHDMEKELDMEIAKLQGKKMLVTKKKNLQIRKVNGLDRLELV